MKSPFHNHVDVNPARPFKTKDEQFKRYLKRHLLSVKLSIIRKLATILFTICCLQASAFAVAQVTISVKDVPLEKVFSLIKKQTGVLILYNQKDLAGAKNVTLDLKKATLLETLEACISGQNLKFYIEGKSVFISKRQPLLEHINNNTFPDSLINIQGRVTDTKNNAIAGATISVKGNEIATSTNADGSFKLSGVKKNATLLITSIGYEDKLVRVGGESRLSIQLNVSAQAMTEITVYNTGFQNVPKERATGSFEKVNNELINRTTTFNVIDRLEGVTNGLLFDRRIDQNGKAKNNIQIRGLFTLTEGISQPLIILDNFPYVGDLSNINPNDIESVTVLRDAAAASIWGAKAGNGVIVLTSKKGKFGQPMRVSINSNITITGRPKLSKLPILGPNDWVDLEKFYYDQGAYDGDINGFYHPPLSPLINILEQVKNGELSRLQADALISQLRSQDLRDEFLKYIYRPSSTAQQYGASISGGGKGYNYLLSLGYDDIKTELKGNDSKRISLRLSNIFQPIDNLEIQFGVGYTNSTLHNNSLGPLGSTEYNPSNTLPISIYSKLADNEGNSLPIAKRFRSSYADTVGGGQLLNWIFKPLDELRLRNDRTSSQAFIATMGLNYRIFKYLSVDFQYQFQKNNQSRNDLANQESFEARDIINMFTNLQSNSSQIRNPVPIGGILNEYDQKIEGHSFRGTANYNMMFGTDHQIVGLIGFSIDQNRVTSNSNTTYGFDNNLGFNNVDLVNQYPTIYGYSMNVPAGNKNYNDILDRYVSTFSNISYTYVGRYTLTGSIRRDASNLFGVETNNKWKPLWSVGVGWNVTNEPFFNIPSISFLNFRATYGYAGNVNNRLSAYNLLTYASGSSNIPINVRYAAISNLGIADLRWEQVNTFNFGIDFALRNQRLNGSIEYYTKKSTDVVWGKPLDITTGFGIIRANSANMKGKGVDIKLFGKIVSSDDFKWESALNFNHSTYKVTKILSPIDTKEGYISSGIDLQPIEGQSPYLVVSYKWAGLERITGDPQGHLNGKISKNYDSLAYFSSFQDQVINGSALPIIFGNLLNNFNWKRLSFSANITYKFKYFVQKNSISYIGLPYGNTHSDYLERWMKPGDELNTNVPSLIYPSNPTRDIFYQNSEINVIEGDHIRLEDLRLSYSPSKILGLNIREFNVFGILGNLNVLIWKKNDRGIDPEFPNGNTTRKSFTFGVRMGF